MASAEEIEKVRQEIMRFRELINIMSKKVQDAERAYTQLFADCDPEDVKSMKQKDLQGKLAQTLVDDLTPLRIAVGQARFDAREMERSFAELYNIIVTVSEP